jgi:hypothetical protein
MGPGAHISDLGWLERTLAPCLCVHDTPNYSIGLAASRVHKEGLPPSSYAIGCLLHLTTWVLIVVTPYPDLVTPLQQAQHLPAVAPRTSLLCASPILALQEGEPAPSLPGRLHTAELESSPQSICVLQICTLRLTQARWQNSSFMVSGSSIPSTQILLTWFWIRWTASRLNHGNPIQDSSFSPPSFTISIC